MGAATLLGDAAHPMVQYIAQGAAMALEDAICLAGAAHECDGDFAKAFQRYQDIRIVRTARVQISSLMMDSINHAKGVERKVRNSLFEGRTPRGILRPAGVALYAAALCEIGPSRFGRPNHRPQRARMRHVQLSRIDESSPRYAGWRVVAACYLAALFCWGFGLYGHGVYLTELNRLHGWPTAMDLRRHHRLLSAHRGAGRVHQRRHRTTRAAAGDAGRGMLLRAARWRCSRSSTRFGSSISSTC